MRTEKRSGQRRESTGTAGNRILGIAAAAALTAVFLGGAAVYGYHAAQTEVRNHIALGDVKIALEQDEGAALERVREVLPSETISELPEIRNLAMPCYVRAKAVWEGASLSGWEDSCAEVDRHLWVQKGDYYYCTQLLQKGEAVKLFRQITVPADWKGDTAGRSFGLAMTAEAIQAAHITPDFAAEDPWGGVEAEICVHEEENGRQSETRSYQELTVVLSGSSAELVAVPEDFFGNLGTLMPGDEASDTVYLRNTSGKNARLFFSSQLESGSELAKQTGLVITKGEQVVYEGTLAGETKGKEIPLGSLTEGSEDTICFTIRVPGQLKNAFALAGADVRWTFRAEMDEKPSASAPPKTGDPSQVVIWLLLCAAGVAGLAVCGVVLTGRRHRR